MSGPGARLAAFAAGVQWDRLPQSLRDQLKRHVLDTIGVMFAGFESAESAPAREAVRGWGAGADATLVGSGERLPAPGAAFINALHGRLHTFDDTYEPGTLHPGSVIIATALALGERTRAGGAQFLSAVAAGYEVSTRVAAAVSPGHYAAGFHNTGTCNAFGAAAAAARLLNFDADATAETFGLAGATAAGLRQHQQDGSMFDSAFHGARAAQCGVMVAQMRAAGLRGPRLILDGPMGFCSVMAPRGADLSRLEADLGTVFEAAKTTIKPWPSCRFNHAPIQAALEVRQRHRVDHRQVERVELRTFRQSIEVSSRPSVDTQFDAILSHQFALANALVHGNVTLAALRDLHGDTAVRDLTSKVSVVHDESLESRYPASWPHHVKVYMKNGEVHEALCEYPPGRLSPIPESVVEAKFRGLATPLLGEERAARLLAAIRNVEALDDIGQVTALTFVQRGRGER